MKNVLSALLVAGIIILTPAISFSDDKPTVFVSILPQKYFVRQISKDLINVEVMVKPGANPATYEPKPSQMRKLAKSEAYLAIGVPFEKSWLDKISKVSKGIKIVHTDWNVQKSAMEAHGHFNGVSGTHGGLDPHIWLSPSLVKKQAVTIEMALAGILPEQAVVFRGNLKDFLVQIERLDRELRELFKTKKGRQFMVFHPSWGYFAHEYGLKQIAVEIEGKSPKPSQLARLIGYAGEEGFDVVFAEPQFSARSAKIIAAEIAGRVELIDPLAEDWERNMKEVAEKISKALR